MFKKAERRKVKLKLAITGVPGAGKTTAAIKMARGLVGKEGKIGIIDTENDSVPLYSDITDFDSWRIKERENYLEYTKAIKTAFKSNYDVLIIDSFSHIWEAILKYKSEIDLSPTNVNSYTNWGKAGDKFNEILNAILFSDIHVICCLRAKIGYVLELNKEGKNVPKKVGMKPIMRDGIEYEFSVVMDLNKDHIAGSDKDRSGCVL